MRSDILIRHEGFKALFAHLDPVEAERFLVMLRRDNQNYTEWRKGLWANQSVEEVAQKAASHWQNKTQS